MNHYRVQVKYGAGEGVWIRRKTYDKGQEISTAGGKRIHVGYEPLECDYFFIVRPEGPFYLIPCSDVAGMSCLWVGGTRNKWKPYEVERE